MNPEKWVEVPVQELFFCERCNKGLHADEIVWLELNCDTGVFHKSGTVSADQSQGCFPFGKACARRSINKSAREIGAKSFS